VEEEAVSRKREPVAELGAEDYLIVKHTHDVDVARRLMTRELVEKNEFPGDPEGFTQARREYVAKRLSRPKQTYVRVQGALPNSFAAAEGWRYAYHEYDQPGPGAFPAVVFLG
jgi:hypothetical protein